MLYPSTTSSTPASDSTTQNLAHLINQNAEQENRQPKLVALSDQTEIQKLGESDMEISDADSETATIVVKKEDEPIIFKQSTPSLLPSQLNSQEWFQNCFQMPKVSSPAQIALNQKEPIILAFLTSKETSIPLRIMLLDSLYQLMGTVNRQLTIVNLYWTYLLQETKVFTPPSPT
jgi:hypothetical protein